MRKTFYVALFSAPSSFLHTTASLFGIPDLPCERYWSVGVRGQTFCAAGLPLTCPGAKKLLRIIHRRSEAWQSPLMVTRRDTCHHPPTRVKYIGTTDFNIHLHTPFFEALAFIVFTLALYFDHDSHVMLTLIHVKGFQKRGFTICSCIHICIVFLHHVNP